MDDFSRWEIRCLACRVAPILRSNRRMEKSSSDWSMVAGSATRVAESSEGDGEGAGAGATESERFKEWRAVGVDERTTSVS